MFDVTSGPLIVEPEVWTVVFSRRATSWWRGFLAFGRYKHVRAYAYAPYLHVWIFYDVHLSGTDIIVAADGPPAERLIASWIVEADLISIPRLAAGQRRRAPVLGFCVPAIRRLLGIPGGALRPDALFRHCLANGGTLFEVTGGHPKI